MHKYLYHILLFITVSTLQCADEHALQLVAANLRELSFMQQATCGDDASAVWFAASSLCHKPVTADEGDAEEKPCYPNEATRWVHELRRWIRAAQPSQITINWQSPDCNTPHERRQHYTTLVARLVHAVTRQPCDDYAQRPEWYTHRVQHELHQQRAMPYDPGLVQVDTAKHTISHVRQRLVRYRRPAVLDALPELACPKEFPEQQEIEPADQVYSWWAVRDGAPLEQGLYRIAAPEQQIDSPVLMVRDGIPYLTKSELFALERVNDPEKRLSLVHVCTPSGSSLPLPYLFVQTPHLADGTYGLKMDNYNSGLLVPLDGALRPHGQSIRFARTSRIVTYNESSAAETIARWHHSGLGCLSLQNCELQPDDCAAVIKQSTPERQRFELTNVSHVTNEMMRAVLSRQFAHSVYMRVQRVLRLDLDRESVQLFNLEFDGRQGAIPQDQALVRQLLESLDVAEPDLFVKRNIKLCGLGQCDAQFLQLLISVAERFAGNFYLTSYAADESAALGFLRQLQQSSLVKPQQHSQRVTYIEHPNSTHCAITAGRAGAAGPYLLKEDSDVTKLYEHVRQVSKQ